jgi:hypothetical protein
MEVAALTLLIFQLNKPVDTGKYDDITIEEVHQHIDDETILAFLSARGKGDMDRSSLVGECRKVVSIG